MSGQLCLKWNNHHSAFNKLLDQIFLEDVYSDATITCQGKFYSVHRFVLSTCSDYFHEVFQQCSTRLNNRHPFIVVKDIHPDQMEALLNYMYKGEVNVPQEMLPELIKAAEAFKIKGLAVPDEEPSPKVNRKRLNNSQASSASKRSKKLNENSFDSSKIEVSSDQFTEEWDSTQNSQDSVTTKSNVEEIYLPESDLPNIKKEPVDFLTDKSSNNEGAEAIKMEQNFQELSEDNSNHDSIDYDGSNRNLDLLNQEAVTWDNSFNNDVEPASILTELPIPVADCLENLDDSSFRGNGFICPYCNLRTPRKDSLSRHIKTVHSKLKPHNCPDCSYKASREDTLKLHITRKHKVDLKPSQLKNSVET